MSPRASRWELLRTWAAIARGRSYAHRPQDLGASFVAGRLEGYFVDLTGKTAYDGPTDAEGLPLTSAGGVLVYHPTIVLQFGLGHWDLWLASQRRADHHRIAFLRVAEWCARSMDASGGLSIWPELGFAMQSRYSAMTQGLAASVLARAWSLTGTPTFLADAGRAMRLALRPVPLGGTGRRVGEGIVLEEAPEDPPNTVLNGWIFAIVGLHDATQAMRPGRTSADLSAGLIDSLEAIAACLPRFDLGWWSRYDLAGHVASPFYHRLHVAQLTALEMIRPDWSGQVAPVRKRWSASLTSPPAFVRAIALKAAQQLVDPPPRIR